VTAKADFNAEEWSTVVEAPLLAGMRVVVADRGGTIRESLAIGKVYSHARQAHGESELLDELTASPPVADPQRLKGAGDLGAASEKRLREALQLVSAKGAPEDVEAYKRFVLSVAQAAAEAHKEGGFAGIGGKQISGAEQAALDEIRSLMDDGTASPPSG
jgi:hypothetical protein